MEQSPVSVALDVHKKPTTCRSGLTPTLAPSWRLTLWKFSFGVRLAVHEVTRWGMGPQEMADIARFFGQVLLESLPVEKVRTEVMALKAQFDTVRYCFDGET